MSVQVHTSGQVTINGDAVLNVSSGDGGGPSTPVDLSGYVKKTELNIVANNLQSQINNLGGGGLNIVEGGEFINCSNPSEGVIVIASEPDPIINYTGLFSLELNQGNALIFDVFLGLLSFGSLPYKLSVMYEYKDLDFTETFLSCNEDQSGKYFYILNERLSVDSTDNLAYKIYLNEYGIVVDLINKITQEVLLSRKKIMYLKSNAFAFAIDSKINPSTHHYAII